jgi:hypothetical protein
MSCFENVYTTLAFVAAYVFFVWVARKIAVDKGLDPTPYFALAIFLTPLVGIIAAIVAKPNAAKVDAQRLASGTERKCPFCAELIKVEAKVCRFCGRELSPLDSVPRPPQNTPTPADFKSRDEYLAWKAGKTSPQPKRDDPS